MLVAMELEGWATPLCLVCHRTPIQSCILPRSGMAVDNAALPPMPFVLVRVVSSGCIYIRGLC
jgi:hypothetical protein